MQTIAGRWVWGFMIVAMAPAVSVAATKTDEKISAAINQFFSDTKFPATVFVIPAWPRYSSGEWSASQKGVLMPSGKLVMESGHARKNVSSEIILPLKEYGYKRVEKTVPGTSSQLSALQPFDLGYAQAVAKMFRDFGNTSKTRVYSTPNGLQSEFTSSGHLYSTSMKLAIDVKMPGYQKDKYITWPTQTISTAQGTRYTVEYPVSAEDLTFMGAPIVFADAPDFSATYVLGPNGEKAWLNTRSRPSNVDFIRGQYPNDGIEELSHKSKLMKELIAWNRAHRQRTSPHGKQKIVVKNHH